MIELECIGKDGQTRTFYYVLQYLTYSPPRPDEWLFLIYDNRNPVDQQSGFYIKFERIDDHSVKSTLMRSPKDHEGYSQRGIPDAILLEAAQLLDRRVISSRGHPPNDTSDVGVYTEWRTDKATKVWERLVKRGLAIYDQAEDHYEIDMLQKN